MTRFRNLRLFWKLLIPFLVLMVFLGVVGGFLTVRDLSSRAETALERDLSRSSLEVRSLLRDRELSLIESANFAANLAGMSEAAKAGDRRKVRELLGSVLSLKTRLNLVAIADLHGGGLVEFSRSNSGEIASTTEARDWSQEVLVREAIDDPQGAKLGGLIEFDGAPSLFSVAAAVCSQTDPCSPVGVAVVGIALDSLSQEATARLRAAPPGRAGVGVYSLEGKRLATSGLDSGSENPPEAQGTGLALRTHDVGSEEVATAYIPLEIQGRRQGTLAVTMPTSAAFSTARAAGLRLALILAVALIGIVAIGAGLSRLILTQVRPLVSTNRALASGDLSARAPVLGRDELGELAQGINQMADELGASVETLEERVAARTEEVQRLLKERTEFFAALSHEFRTPLAVILREAEMMLNPKYSKAGRRTSDTGRLLKDSGQQLLSLINDILELAKAEVGRIEVDLQEVDLRQVVREARPVMSSLAEDSQLNISIRLPKELPRVVADKARLREMILNLVDNAVKYTPAGGSVRLTAAASNGVVSVSIADTGVGIPAEVGDRIFEPFFRVPGISAQRGQAATGLGLALTRRLVEAHGGEISFESEPGSGSTFTFTVHAAGSKRLDGLTTVKPQL